MTSTMREAPSQAADLETVRRQNQDTAKEERLIDIAIGFRNYVEKNLIKSKKGISIGSINRSIQIFGDMLNKENLRAFGIDEEKKITIEDRWDLLEFLAEKSTLNPKNNASPLGLDEDTYMHLLALDLVISRGVKRSIRLEEDGQSFEKETKPHLVLLSDMANWVEDVHEPRIEEYSNNNRPGILQPQLKSQSQVRTGMPVLRTETRYR